MSWIKQIDAAAGGDFGSWYQREIQPLVEPMIVGLVDEVQAHIDQQKSLWREQEKIDRDRWFLFNEHSLKSSASVQRKLAADFEKHPMETLTEAALRAAVLGLADLGRFRVVGSLPRDVETIKKVLLKLDGASTEVKDFVRDTALRKPLLGHRAIQFRVTRQGISAEIQIMTHLQHVWDRRNHCLYEWTREGGGDDALDLRLDDHALAEALYVVDRMADQNFSTLLSLRSTT